MNTLKGGMIGAGFWSEIQLTAWSNTNGAEIVALCDRHPDRRDPIASRFGITSLYDDFEQMLDNEDLDFVDICVRPYGHAPLTRLAADRGLTVLCQKPFCTTLDEAVETVAYCRDRNVRLMINENFRWQGWYRKTRELLDEGALGKPFWARIHRRIRTTLPGFNHTQAYFTEMPHLVTYEMGVHYLDTIRYLFGDPESLFARAMKISPHIAGDDVLTADLLYPELTVQIATSWASVTVPGIDFPENVEGPMEWPYSVPPPRLEIEGTDGTLALMPDRTLRLTHDNDQQEWPFDANVRVDSPAAAQQHFIDCVNSGDRFETSGEETLKTMALVWACYQSTEKNEVIRPFDLLK